MNDPRNSRRRAAAILLLIAVFSLLLTLAFIVPRPDAAAMQVGQTVRSTPSLTVISPLQPPTATQQPRPTRVSMLPITDASEVAALLARYHDLPGQNSAHPTPAAAGSWSPRAATPAAPRYLPLVLASGRWKGVGDGAFSDVWSLDAGWWYDWGHWTLDSAVVATVLPDRLTSYLPMVWCANRPEDGLLASSWTPQDLASKAARYPGRTWLIYNEPDMPFLKIGNDLFFAQCAHLLCNMVGRTPLPPGTTPTAGPTPTPPLPYRCSYTSTSPATPTWYPGLRQEMARLAADRYAEIYRVVKDADPTARLFCCGNFYTADSAWWSTETGQSWTSFLSRLQWLKENDARYPDLALDGVHIHTYPWSDSTDCRNSPPAANNQIWNCLKERMSHYLIVHQSRLFTRSKPILITEYGSLENNVPAVDVVTYLMRPLAGWIASDDNRLDTGDFGVDGVAWFVTGTGAVTSNTWLLEMTATPTWPSSPTPSPTLFDVYRSTPASTPRGILGVQWATYSPDQLPPPSTPTPFGNP